MRNCKIRFGSFCRLRMPAHNLGEGEKLSPTRPLEDSESLIRCLDRLRAQTLS
jgi:hypothetical protein